MAKQTVPLSQLFDHAVNELHPSPCVKGFETLQKIVHNVPAANAALRSQLISKMRAFTNSIVTNKEMYYCLCLVDHLVKREACFRPQTVHPDFLQWFECVSGFEVSCLARVTPRNTARESGVRTL